jgi:hypothetical protein
MDAIDWPAEEDEFTKTPDEAVRLSMKGSGPGWQAKHTPGPHAISGMRVICATAPLPDRTTRWKAGHSRAGHVSLTQSLNTSQQTVWQSAYDRDGR